MIKKIVIHTLSWLAVLITMITIVNFSLEDGEKSSETSGGVVDTIIEMSPNKDEITPLQRNNITISVRKLGHFCAYFILSFFLTNAFSLLFNKIMPYPMLLALAGSLQFALFDEFVVQARTSGRAAEWADIVTDFSGAIFGALMFLSLWFVVRFIIKMIKRKS